MAMAGTRDLTVEILKQIRDELKLTRTELSERIGQTNDRLDRTNERLDRTVHEQIRHATAIVDLERGQTAIVAVLERLSAGQDRLSAGQGQLVASQEQIVVELQRLNSRIDHVFVGPMGETLRDHQERITRLEKSVETIKRRPG